MKNESGWRQTWPLCPKFGQRIHRRLVPEQQIERLLNAIFDGLREKWLRQTHLAQVTPINQRLIFAPIESDRNPTIQQSRLHTSSHRSSQARRLSRSAFSTSLEVKSNPCSWPN